MDNPGVLNMYYTEATIIDLHNEHHHSLSWLRVALKEIERLVVPSIF